MRKKMLILFMLIYNIFSASADICQIEVVELNEKLVGIFRSFIEYELGCECSGNYPQNSILAFYPAKQDNSEPNYVISNAPYMEFYPDGESYYKCKDIKYVSYLNIEDKQYVVFIESNSINLKDLCDISKYTDNYITIIKETTSPHCFDEYDPSYIKIFHIASPLTKETGYYIEWPSNKYCW